MRTKTTPWNRSYKLEELDKSLKRHRHGGVRRSPAQKAVKREAQKNFRIHEKPKIPRELPADWRKLGENRKRAMERVEDQKLAEELREIWE